MGACFGKDDEIEYRQVGQGVQEMNLYRAPSFIENEQA